MILIADSGSTKTEWCVIDHTGILNTIHTPGINPFYQTILDITDLIKVNFPLQQYSHFDAIFFYGAGCINEEKKEMVQVALLKCFSSSIVEVESDLLAAARSLCGKSEGIACILGTGSNSCYYNGKEIAENVSPLGYVLGDEGSGAVLGKRLLGDILKNEAPQNLIKDFFITHNTSSSEIMNCVYRQSFPNRYLASFTPFLSSHLEEAYVIDLLTDEFQRFVSRNIFKYENIKNLQINFTGSIAFYFSKILNEVLTFNGLYGGKVVQNPMAGLVNYHM